MAGMELKVLAKIGGGVEKERGETRAIKSLKRIRNDLRPRQTTLFDMPEEPEPQPPAVIEAEFNGRSVRIIMIDGEPWWVLSDVAKILGYRDAEVAARNVRPHQRRTLSRCMTGASRDLIVISEGGRNRLLLKCQLPAAEPFQDWVTDEVLPAIRKTGRYVVRGTEKLTPLQKARDENRKQNIKDHEQIHAAGGVPRDYMAHHNGIYLGQFGLSASSLRRRLDVTDSPLNHMDVFSLLVNGLSKVAAEKKREAAEAAGTPVPLSARPALNRDIARRVTADALATLGGEYQQNVIDTPEGKILGVERKSLGNPDRLALGHSR